MLTQRKKFRPMANINVTPFVDVMLVLLIVFMVTAPLLTSGVAVNLATGSSKPLSRPQDPITVTIDANGSLYLGDTPVSMETLVDGLNSASENDLERQIFLRADKDIIHGRFAEVMGRIADAGYQNLSMLSKVRSD